MPKNSGQLYILDDNRYGVAYKREQNISFEAIDKVLIHVYKDRMCTQPELDETGNQKKPILKHKDKLKLIGFTD